ncbi:hypothetical protein GN958_ATG14225 [Phytophthora infestans]|uniref:Uncharacterized protein n=1 Tax=Phytophthora infestans TaxID=4787 RepID=A0A8S9U7S4_PHYIN|nr:hypothetical protein GN958_ATG14225 [Phytophthora infestans]
MIMDVNSPAKWDFLASWCEELSGQVTAIHNNVIRVLGPRRKREKPFRFDVSDDEQGEEKEDPEEIEKGLWKTREAMELLSLVAKVDARAFHMLMSERCGLRLDDEESEEEEEEFRMMLPGDNDGDIILSNYEESEEGEDEDRQGEDRSIGDEQEDEGDEDDDSDEEGDDVLVLPPDALKRERRQERQSYLLPRFDFVSLTGVPRLPDPKESPTQEWEKLFLAEAPQYQPGEEYKKARARILEMQSKARPRVPSCLEIPVSLEFGNWSQSADQLAEDLKDVGTLLQKMKNRADSLDSMSKQDENCADSAGTFIYRLVELSMTISHRDNVNRLLAQRLCGMLGNGVPVGELHLCLRDGSGGSQDQAAYHETLANLFTGMLIRPLTPKQKQLPCFSDLHIDCEDSALWQFEALCSALTVTQASIRNLCLPGACNERKTPKVRRRFWRSVAQTFFHTNSAAVGPFSSVRALDLSDVELTLEDLAEITAVLEEKEHNAQVSPQWDLCRKRWMLRGNTPLEFVEKEGDSTTVAAGSSITLPYDARVELVQNDSDEKCDDENDFLDVLIPAYGQCRVRRESVLSVATERQELPAGEPLSSLSLALKTEAEGLEGLLQQIGWSLRKLSLAFHREIDVNAMVPGILKSCPNLTTLALDESYIDLDRFSTLYEGTGAADEEALPVLSTLQFQDYYGIGDGDGKLFMKRLGDSTTRLAKHLRELTIHAEEYAEPLDHPTLSELCIALEQNTTLEKLQVMVSRTIWSAIWKRRLRRFNGQVLPPHPLPLPCKLAFLSVAHSEGYDSYDSVDLLHAVKRLDSGVLSLIFAFAATPVVRSVQIYG